MRSNLKDKFNGYALFLIFYSFFRFNLEFFRQPDSHLGLIIGNMSMGQILTLPMFIVGIIFLKNEKKTLKYIILLRMASTLSLSRFIFLCLYEKDHGYYQKNRIGTDFITAPEISQLFGECISIFIASINERFGKIRDFCELGPGNGTLIKDLSKNLNKLIKEELNFFLFEKSNSLVKNIKKNIKNVNISYLKKLIFPPRPIFFIANEFFDALPINQFEKTSNGWLERRIDLVEGKLKLTLKKNPFFKF